MIAPLSIRRLLLGGIAATAMAAVATPSLAEDGAGIAPVNAVYPALRQDGASFLVTTGADGRINECDAVDSAARTPAVDRSCALLAGRGIPAGIAPARAIGNQAAWLTFNDIPESMMTTNTHVGAQLIFEVDQSGKVSACRPYKSTGMAAFDAFACKMLQERARFTPATYKGAPVLAVGTTFVKFDSD